MSRQESLDGTTLGDVRKQSSRMDQLDTLKRAVVLRAADALDAYSSYLIELPDGLSTFSEGPFHFVAHVRTTAERLRTQHRAPSGETKADMKEARDRLRESALSAHPDERAALWRWAYAIDAALWLLLPPDHRATMLRAAEALDAYAAHLLEHVPSTYMFSSVPAPFIARLRETAARLRRGDRGTSVETKITMADALDRIRTNALRGDPDHGDDIVRLENAISAALELFPSD